MKKNVQKIRPPPPAVVFVPYLIESYKLSLCCFSREEKADLQKSIDEMRKGGTEAANAELEKVNEKENAELGNLDEARGKKRENAS